MFESVGQFLLESILPLLISVIGGDNSLVAALQIQPLLLIPLLLLPGLVLLIIALAVQFVKDSWRLGIGVIIDILAIVLFVLWPWWLVLLAFAASFTFHFLTGGTEIQHKIYTGTTALRFFLLLPFIPIPEPLKAALVLIPICTLLMFSLCITD